MGWLRWVGSIKSQVFFAEYHLFYRALLQKRPIILRSLLIVATPYVTLSLCVCARECLIYQSSPTPVWRDCQAVVVSFNMTHSYMWRDVTYFTRHDASLGLWSCRLIWQIHICAVTWLTLMWRDQTRRLWSCRLIWLIYICDVTWRDLL